jgi:hypothetical protein
MVALARHDPTQFLARLNSKIHGWAGGAIDTCMCLDFIPVKNLDIEKAISDIILKEFDIQIPEALYDVCVK